jgi:YidC/Oxa1 family membrane protein insertase
MERRALIAFVASMVLFLAYDALYLSPKQKKMEARRQALVERQQHEADSLAALAPAPAPDETLAAVEDEPPAMVDYDAGVDTAAALPQTQATGSTVTVASDDYEITLTSNGAEVVSAKLLNYSTAGEPVELFWQNTGWSYERVLNVSLEGPGAPVPLHGVDFTAYQGASPTPLGDGARVTVDEKRGYTDIVFRAELPGGGVVERGYRFFAGRYDFETSLRYPGTAFPGIESVKWGLGPGISTTEVNANDDYQNFRASIQLGEEYHHLKPSDFSKKSEESYNGTLNWAALQTKYFLVAMVPPEPTRADVDVAGAKDSHRITANITLPAPATRGEVTQTLKVYFGPLDFDALEPIGSGLDKTIQLGWKFIRPVSWLVLKAMIWMHGFIPNYGWVIIIISVLTKVLFYRLTHKSFKSMKEMQELQPRLQALKEKYGDDRQKLSQETMRVYKEQGVNPLGGCLPMLLQMPVFIALFNVLKFTIELRGAPWAGWITDLSQQDVLFHLPITLPLLGDAFSLLPILMGASMFAQSKLGGSPTGGPSAATPPGFQTMLPIVFTVLFYKMPSGLVIYWIINTVLSVAQQYYIHREADSSKTSQSDVSSASGKRKLKSKER